MKQLKRKIKLEDYVSFEVAKMLKEKGFDEKTLSYYENNILCNGDWYEWNRSPLGHIAAPTHQMAMGWFRETHKIDIIIDISDPSVKDRKYYCMIWDGNNNSYILDLFNSYPEAVEAALKYCLENLI